MGLRDVARATPRPSRLRFRRAYIAAFRIDRQRSWASLSSVRDARGAIAAVVRLGFEVHTPPRLADHAPGSAITGA